VFAIHRRAWLWLQRQSVFIAMRVSIAAALLGALILLGFPLPGVLLTMLGLAGTLAGGWIALAELLNQFAHRNRYSPGANDNASGVGVVLALAEHFAARPPAHVRLGFLFTGAEETGLHGATAFAATVTGGAVSFDPHSASLRGLSCAARTLSGAIAKSKGAPLRSGRLQHDQRPMTLDPAKTAVLNFDMVGGGHRLGVVTRDGTLFALRTDEKLNALVHAAHPAAESLHHTLRSSDVAAFLRRGLPATGLQTLGSAEAELAYHTSNDTIAVVQPAALDLAARTALEMIQRVETCPAPLFQRMERISRTTMRKHPFIR
jgi:Zn-dependent M28 family amino/carboxypeptidase